MTKVETFYSICGKAIAHFKQKGTVKLSSPEIEALQAAYIEIGGHPFDKTCADCVPEVLARFIKHTKHLPVAGGTGENATANGEVAKPAPQKKSREELTKEAELIKSGYAGITAEGTIVDRREHKDATPIKKNDQLGVPQPKEIEQESTSTQEEGEEAATEETEEGAKEKSDEGNTGGTEAHIEDLRTKKMLAEILKERKIEIPHNANRNTLLDLVKKSDSAE